MEQILVFLKSLYSPDGLMNIVKTGGYTVLPAIIFSETGLFLGFFLPGDSLLFTAGLVAGTSPDVLNIWTLMILLSVMAIVGDATGYYIGKKAGEPLYRRKKALWHKHLMASKEFFERHGGKAIFLARFVPFARTFAPVVAGISQMEYLYFAVYNIFGGICWIWSMSAMGYFLGNIEWVRKNLEKVVVLIIILSILPIVIEYFRNSRRKRTGKKRKGKS